MRGINIGRCRGIELLADGRVRGRSCHRRRRRRSPPPPRPASSRCRCSARSTSSMIPGAGRGSRAVPPTGRAAGVHEPPPHELTDVLDRRRRAVRGRRPRRRRRHHRRRRRRRRRAEGDELAVAIDAAPALADVAHEDRRPAGPFLADCADAVDDGRRSKRRFLDRLDDFGAIATLVADPTPTTFEATLDGATTPRRCARPAPPRHRRATSTPPSGPPPRCCGADLPAASTSSRLPSTPSAPSSTCSAPACASPDRTASELTALKGFITVDLCLVFGICLLPEGGIGAPATSVVGTAAAHRTGRATGSASCPIVDAL